MFKDLDISSASNFYKLKAGENKVRLVSAPIKIWSAFVDGSARKFLTEEAVKEYNASVTEDKHKAKARFALWVLDRASDEVLLAEFGSSIMKSIMALANDSDVGFEGLPPYDIKIVKEGEGLETRYNVFALPPSDLTEDETKRIEAQQNLMEFLREGAEDGASVPPEFLA